MKPEAPMQVYTKIPWPHGHIQIRVWKASDCSDAGEFWWELRHIQLHLGAEGNGYARGGSHSCRYILDFSTEVTAVMLVPWFSLLRIWSYSKFWHAQARSVTPCQHRP